MTEGIKKNSPIEQLSAEQIWDKCLTIIKDNVQYQTFRTWFEPITAVSFENDILTIQVPSQFFYEWLEEHFVDLLGKTIRRVIGKNAGLNYRIKMNSAPTPATMNLAGGAATKSTKPNYVDLPLKVDNPRDIVNPFVIPGVKRLQIDSQLNPKFTFQNFVEGACNRLSRNAGLHIAKKPGQTSFNPLMVFGGTGCGKTHLLHAIGNEIKNTHPNKTVLYVSAEKFVNQFMDHSRNNLINDFIHFYQLIDVLLMDDIHLFVNAVKSQEAFFAIFNHLHQSGKQIVLTSDTAPNKLEGLNERLITRFRWGLTAEIEPPDYETRKQILMMMMKNEGLEVDNEVVEYIAYNIQENLRDLEGAIISLFAQATLNQKEIDLELAKQVVKNYVKTRTKELTIEDIHKMVCQYYNLEYEDLLTPSRKQKIVEARQITMYLAKNFTNSTLKAIGNHFSGKDHTTVIHSCQKVESLLDVDEDYKEKFLEIQHKVKLASI